MMMMTFLGGETNSSVGTYPPNTWVGFPKAFLTSSSKRKKKVSAFLYRTSQEDMVQAVVQAIDFLQKKVSVQAKLIHIFTG